MDYFSSAAAGRSDVAATADGPVTERTPGPSQHLRAEPLDSSGPLTPFGHSERLQHAPSRARYLRTPTTPGPSTVRIQRLRSAPKIKVLFPSDGGTRSQQMDGARESGMGRRRSESAPQPPHQDLADRTLKRQRTSMALLPTLREGNIELTQQTTIGLAGATHDATQNRGRFRSASNLSVSSRASDGSGGVKSSSMSKRSSRLMSGTRREYDSNVVDVLDVVDPEVSTLNTLNNVQNSLFVPDLGRLLNRRPTYTLTRPPTRVSEEDSTIGHSDEQSLRRRQTNRHRIASRSSVAPRLPPVAGVQAQTPDAGSMEMADEAEDATEEVETPSNDYELENGGGHTKRRTSLDSTLHSDYYAVLPHGISVDDWTEEDIAQLNDHVRHMLHSRRSKFKRSMKGFGQYVRKPLGFFVTLYAFLITMFGLIWVLFLIGWIGGGYQHKYFINIIDNVLVALFAVVGDGLAPFRAVDTYHMIYIAHYHHLTWRLRKERQLPELSNPYDLPSTVAANGDADADAEASAGPSDSLTMEEPKHEELSVLSPKQQASLNHHTEKFSKSHTFYKPHETTTHHAFSVGYLIAVVVLLDCHSLLQIALGACTWGISYHVRPQALTAVILSFSITCNVTAGVLISVGDRLSRKKDVVERMSRQALTQEALAKVKRRKERAQGAALKRTASLEAVERTAAELEERGREEKERVKRQKEQERKEKELKKGRKSLDLAHARPEKYVEDVLEAPHGDLKTEEAVLRKDEEDTNGLIKAPG